MAPTPVPATPPDRPVFPRRLRGLTLWPSRSRRPGGTIDRFRGGQMRISDVLQTKGSSVTTLDASATVRELVDVLADRGIGAVIVSSEGRSPAGMVSERDV